MKKRLDVLVVERGFAPSPEVAQRLILAGEIYLAGARVDKPGTQYPEDAPLEFKGRQPQFVSRGGEKLAHGLTAFNIDPTNRVCLDVGASTGGFTDCLLQRGARHVFSTDVGYGQLDAKLRSHPQVSNLEKVNARHLKLSELVALNPLASEISILVADVSFISLRVVLENLIPQFRQVSDWLLLFKPQFELEREQVGKKGLVREGDATQLALSEFVEWSSQRGLKLQPMPERSPLVGKRSGNVEYFLYGTPI